MRKPAGEPRSPHGAAVPHLRAWRLRKLMSMRMLSESARISTNTINALEKGGYARFDTISKLAKALGISSEDLVFKEPPKGEDGRGAA